MPEFQHFLTFYDPVIIVLILILPINFYIYLIEKIAKSPKN
jgi:hypothetical protein